jgi:AcrR family transcriptional regulator
MQLIPTLVIPTVVTCDASAGQPARRPRRRRGAQTDQAIIEAALAMFAESGIQGLCIEAVAARAGVGKGTIYRRWRTKEDLLVDALATLKRPLPEQAGISVRDDLITLLQAACDDMADRRHVRAAALLYGEGFKYPRVAARFAETVVEPRREVFRSVLRRGIETGEIRPDIDVDIAALFTLIGAVHAKTDGGMDDIPPGYATQIVDQVLQGIALRSDRSFVS